jgi:hypothetical protein
MARSKYSRQDIANAREQLDNILKPGSVVYALIRHVSSSGMSRDIDLYTVRGGEILRITWASAMVLGRSFSKDGAIRIGGAGMDMGFALVYELAQALYGDGYKLSHRQL